MMPPVFGGQRPTGIFGIPLKKQGIPKEPLFETPKIELSQERPEKEFDIRDIYQPDTRATDAFMQLMREIPQREKPTLSRRILAGLTTLGPEGAQGGERVLYGEHARRMQDFGVKADLLKDLAQSERSANVNERLLASQILRQDIADRRLAETERAHRATEENREKRYQLSQFMANNPNHQIRVDESGEFVAFNPKNPAEPAVRTGIKSGEISDIERLGMIIGAQGERQIKEQEFRREIEAERERRDREMAELREELRAQRPPSPQDVQAEQDNIMRRLATNPEYKPFFAPDPSRSSGYTLRRRRAGLTGPKQEELDRIYNELGKQIYGSSFQGIGTTSTTTEQVVPQKPNARSIGAGPGPVTPKVGDTKTFPNGNVGRWDGKGWVLVSRGK
jgi:hypothetical protein